MCCRLTRGTEAPRKVGETLFKATGDDRCQAKIEMHHSLLVISTSADMCIGVKPGDCLTFICRQVEMDRALFIHDQVIDQREKFICTRALHGGNRRGERLARSEVYRRFTGLIIEQVYLVQNINNLLAILDSAFACDAK